MGTISTAVIYHSLSKKWVQEAKAQTSLSKYWVGEAQRQIYHILFNKQLGTRRAAEDLSYFIKLAREAQQNIYHNQRSGHKKQITKVIIC